MLENDLQCRLGNYEGVYTFQGIWDGMDYWVNADGDKFIWYTDLCDLCNLWKIGYFNFEFQYYHFDIYSFEV